MRTKRLLASIIAVSMAFALCATALAATYDLAAGDVIVNGTTVTGTTTAGEFVNGVEDTTDIVITQTGEGSTSNTITVGGGANVTISGVDIEAGKNEAGITVKGDATINLDGENTVTGGQYAAGINVGKGDSVTITGEGSLTATGGEGGAGIGGSNGVDGANTDDSNAGTITITGEKTEVEAIGGNSAAGIGGGYGNSKLEDTGNGGTTTITGGAEVTAQGGTNGAGIGGGATGEAGTIVISGGADVTATGGSTATSGGAGIGSGSHVTDLTPKDDVESGAESSITITGKDTTVNATGGSSAAGIGTGYEGGTVGSITISEGADVTAQGGAGSSYGAAGIGTGATGATDILTGTGESTVGTITITGENTSVTANGGQSTNNSFSGAGVGTSGLNGRIDEIIINGVGSFKANGAMYAAGVGTGGYAGSINKITITGVTAILNSINGGTYGADIGTGYAGTVGTITIKDSNLALNGGAYTAALGTGWAGTVTNIVIDNSKVNASTGSWGAAIGGGYNGNIGTITIENNSAIVALGGWGASAIGGADKAGGTISIDNTTSLTAISDGTKFAVDITGSVTGVENVLNAKFASLALEKGVATEIEVLDAEGNVIATLVLPIATYADGTTVNYRAFAVNVPTGGSYYVRNSDGNYDNSFAGYQEDSKLYIFAVPTDGILTADELNFPTYDVNYSFVSGTEGMELPEEITALLPEGETHSVTSINGVATPAVPTEDAFAVENGVWFFTGWDESVLPIATEGNIAEELTFVGTWVFERNPIAPNEVPDPTDDPTESDDIPLGTPGEDIPLGMPSTGDGTFLFVIGLALCCAALAVLIPAYARAKRHSA